MNQDQAEKIAIQALGWLAEQEGLLGVFLGASGTDINNLKEVAGDPVFLGGVLDFVLMDDNHVIGFCDTVGLEYDVPMAARQALPGGEMINWT